MLKVGTYDLWLYYTVGILRMYTLLSHPPTPSSIPVLIVLLSSLHLAISMLLCHTLFPFCHIDHGCSIAFDLTQPLYAICLVLLGLYPIDTPWVCRVHPLSSQYFPHWQCYPPWPGPSIPCRCTSRKGIIVSVWVPHVSTTVAVHLSWRDAMFMSQHMCTIDSWL